MTSRPDHLSDGKMALHGLLGATVPNSSRHVATNIRICVCHAGNERFLELMAVDSEAQRVRIRDGEKKPVHSRAYPARFFDLSADPRELNDLAETGDQDMDRVVALAERPWPFGVLAEDVLAAQTAQKLVDGACLGPAGDRDFTPNPAEHDHVRRGGAFPGVERRGCPRCDD